MRVIWSEPATWDLDRIVAYIAERNPIAAQTVAQTIYEGCASLSDFPMRGQKSRIPGRRDLVFTSLPYIAVYRVQQHQVEIIRIYHMAQDWS